MRQTQTDKQTEREKKTERQREIWQKQGKKIHPYERQTGRGTVRWTQHPPPYLEEKEFPSFSYTPGQYCTKVLGR